MVNLPSRIWLFGGRCLPDANQKHENTQSLRESFWRLAFQVPFGSPHSSWISGLDIPENHQGWWAFSGYEDLLMFERDACHLARATLLIPESPGSHAELGALAVDDTIVQRLLVIVEEKYDGDDRRESFLNLGPIRRAQKRDNKCVIGSYDSPLLENHDFDAILDFVADRLPSVHKSERLVVENPTHRLLLTADLVDLCLVIKIVDLQAALAYFGVKVAQEELLRMVQLLSFFGLVNYSTRGLEKFVSRVLKSEAPWVDYQSHTRPQTFERSRFKVDRLDQVKANARLSSMLEKSK